MVPNLRDSFCEDYGHNTIMRFTRFHCYVIRTLNEMQLHVLLCVDELSYVGR